MICIKICHVKLIIFCYLFLSLSIPLLLLQLFATGGSLTPISYVSPSCCVHPVIYYILYSTVCCGVGRSLKLLRFYNHCSSLREGCRGKLYNCSECKRLYSTLWPLYYIHPFAHTFTSRAFINIHNGSFL